MFRLATKAFAKPSVRRAVGLSAVSLTGLGLTTSVAFAKAPAADDLEPLKVSASEVTTGVPKLTPRDMSEVRPVELEEPQQERRAYDPETGEIDWDCPCLGGMAHGPCGEEFKEAFACFVYSKEEIKGSECIPKFSAMQNCFRKYPEVYADFQGDDEQDAKDTQDIKDTKDSKRLKESAESKAQDAAKDAKGVAEATKESAQHAEEAIKDAKDLAVDVAQEAKETAQESKEVAKSKAEELQSQGSEVVHDVKEATADAAAGVQEKTPELVETAQNTLHEVGEFVSESAAGLAAETQDAVQKVEKKFK